MGLGRLREYVRLSVVASLATSFVVLAGPAHAQDVREVPPVLVRAAHNAPSVAAGDMDNDGIVDLLTPKRDGKVDFMRGQGAGRFDLPVVVARAGKVLGDSVVGDFDSDGILDLAVGRSQSDAGSLVLLRGVGDGRFDTAVSIELVAAAGTLTMTDLNGDGDQDLLVVSPGADAVNVLLGAEGIGFTALPPVTVGALPRGLDVADLDGDGDLDFAVANRESNSVSLRYGDGTGLFTVGAEVPTRQAPQDVIVSDVDGDGVVDLAIGSNGEPDADNGTLAVLRGTGPAAFSEIRAHRALKFIDDVSAADFDGDGYLDFVVGTGDRGQFGEQESGYLSVVGGGPGSRSEIVVSQVGERASDVTIADLDGDTDLDVVSTRGVFFVAILFDPLG